MHRQQKPIKPEYHKVLEEKQVSNRGKVGLAFKLKWNSKLTEQAICRGIDTELFYPVHRDITPEEENMFARMCLECPVMLMCLEWGLAHKRHGIWGGTTPYRRWQERKRRGWAVVEPDTVL